MVLEPECFSISSLIDTPVPAAEVLIDLKGIPSLLHAPLSSEVVDFCMSHYRQFSLPPSILLLLFPSVPSPCVPVPAESARKRRVQEVVRPVRSSPRKKKGRMSGSESPRKTPNVRP